MTRPDCPDPNALLAAQQTNHWRYCELCDPAHPAYNPAYHAVVRKIAGDQAVDSALVPRQAATLDPWEYITTERLVHDTMTLLALLPGDVDLVVGISRSGLVPAGLLAFHAHLPLLAVSCGQGLVDVGHGIRLDERRSGPVKHIVLVDDTVTRGREMTANFQTVRQAYPDAQITRAVVYAHPQALAAVDLYVAVYPGLHFLEWNWPNDGHGTTCVYDFDGILCQDCPPADDDDGPRYRHFLKTVKPLFLPRRGTIPMIVTGRHRIYEPETREWLARHRLEVDRLVMRTFEIDPEVPFAAQIAEFKAARYAETSYMFFAESDPVQARLINEATGRAVICPPIAKVFKPRAVQRAVVAPSGIDPELYQRIVACPHRVKAACNCSKLFECKAGKGDPRSGLVSLPTCIECLGGKKESAHLQLPAPAPEPLPIGAAVHLVVAAYRENLDWLAKVAVPFQVYCKGETCSWPSISLPNVGREAHTYVHHVVTHYNTLADVTIFTQGDPFDHAPDFLDRIGAAFTAPTSLTKHYRPNWPDNGSTDFDLVTEHAGFPIRLGDARRFANRTPIVNEPWLNEAWGLMFDGPPPNPWHYGYGAMYAVPRANIQARPLAWWRQLLTILRDAPELDLFNPRNGYAMETLWLYVFDPSYQLKTP